MCVCGGGGGGGGGRVGGGGSNGSAARVKYANLTEIIDLVKILIFMQPVLKRQWNQKCINFFYLRIKCADEHMHYKYAFMYLKFNIKFNKFYLGQISSINKFLHLLAL